MASTILPVSAKATSQRNPRTSTIATAIPPYAHLTRFRVIFHLCVYLKDGLNLYDPTSFTAKGASYNCAQSKRYFLVFTGSGVGDY